MVLISINGTNHQECSYQDVAEVAVTVHAGLGSLGIGAGQKILLLISNRPELLPLIVGAACANVAFAYDFRGYAADVLADSMQDFHFDAIFCEYRDVEEVFKLPLSLTTVKHIIVLGAPAEETEVIIGSAFTWKQFLCMGEEARNFLSPCVKYIEGQICYMSATSGTTGKPKMVVHCHESLVASVQANSHPHHMGLNGKDTLLCTGTIGHVYALFGCICKSIVHGASTIFLEAPNTDEILEALEKHKVSTLATVPYMARCLLDHPQRFKYDLSSLQYLITATNYISEDVGRRLFDELKLKSYVQEKRPPWPGIERASLCSAAQPLSHRGGCVGQTCVQFIRGGLRQDVGELDVYGQTEFVFITGGLLTEAPRFGSIGRLGMGVEAMVIDNKTGKPLGPGHRGELLVKGPGLMRGYWGRLDEPFTDANGWYRTGDECYYDEDEWLYLVQRLSEFIHCRNCKIAPAEIEAVLLKCPQVQDCAVMGLPNPEAGQLPHAVVVPKPRSEDFDPEHFQRFVDARVPKSLRLEGGVTIVDAIPRNKLGKLVRRELLKLVLGRRANRNVN
ncbi:uncharacterized protein LOC144179636 isoform X1 [Haemaphysalis longicornis]